MITEKTHITEEVLEIIQDFVKEFLYRNNVISTEEEPAEVNVKFFEVGEDEGDNFILIDYKGDSVGSILWLKGAATVSYYYDIEQYESKSLQH